MVEDLFDADIRRSCHKDLPRMSAEKHIIQKLRSENNSVVKAEIYLPDGGKPPPPLDCTPFETAKIELQDYFTPEKKTRKKRTGKSLGENSKGGQRAYISVCHGLLKDILLSLKKYGFDPELKDAKCQLLKKLYMW